MPSEEMWDDFFDPLQVIEKMEIHSNLRTLVDVGCGYGTFLFPAAKKIKGTVLGIDIEEEMIICCRKKSSDLRAANVELVTGDISNSAVSLLLEKYSGTVDYISLFNILHCEEPLRLLNKVSELLSDSGKIGVTHWNYGITPRGPSLEIRPKPEQIITWATEAGLSLQKQIDLPPYHFGLLFYK